MKKILTLAAIALIGLSAITSCSKKSSSPSPTTPTYSMKATAGGTSYSAGNCIAFSSAGVLVIEGLGGSTTAPTFPYVAMWLSNWNGAAGTLSFDSTQSTNWGEYLTSATTVSISKTGSVVITSVSTTAISGTYSFTCTDGTVVSGGTFTAKRQ